MTEPLLLRVARLCVGLVEVPGPGNNPTIMHWATDINAPAYTADAVPWCAVAANRWAMACGYSLSGSGYDLLRAKSFETWGQPLETPTLGCILVFQRPEGGHVGLYVGERADAYRVLGGNQGNAVGYSWIAKSRLTAMRWPDGVALPEPRRMVVADAGAVSANES